MDKKWQRSRNRNLGMKRNFYPQIEIEEIAKLMSRNNGYSRGSKKYEIEMYMKK